MKKIVAVLLLAACCGEATAQRVFQMGSEYVVSEMGGLSLTPLEDHFGDDTHVLIGPIDQAIANAGDDSFKLEFKKVVTFGFGQTDNSCAVASNNLIDDVKGNDLLPEGWKITQAGTLGTMTNGMSKVETWFSGQELDPLNPPSFAHTLSIIESPDGNFYTIDNWSSGGLSVKVEQVYPLGEGGLYFTTDPNETDVNKAQFRIQDNDRGTCAYKEDCEPKKKEDSSVSPIPPTSETAEVEVLTSADPNDKLGMWGVGENRYILPGRTMDYIIRFENMPDASAPAQEVLIRDTLDTQVFDLSTFELGDITFGDRTVSVPRGLRSFFTRVPLDDPRFELLIDANLVMETGIVTWRFTTFDPELNDLPFDPLDGFLPPNKTSPEGEGSVSFTLRALGHLPNEARIRNEARIYFDLNDPIDTDPWINTIDTGLPSSRVIDLGPYQRTSEFEVAWEGSDAGSGARNYDIYVSVNDGPFVIWQRNTFAIKARFQGYEDSTYAFFSIATDAVGNVEPMKTSADFVTFVSNEDEPSATDLPTAFRLDQNYPNPFNPTTTIRYAVPRHGRIVIRIYDTLGRTVTTLVDEDRAPGWHDVQFHAGHLASGVYFYQLSADGFTDTRKFVLLK
jgi:hypothetical protein